MPNENETRPCSTCDGLMRLTRDSLFAGGQAGMADPKTGIVIWPFGSQPAWVCDKNREHYELLS